ncbi:MAG TPA: GNAT family N-acetyltransferase [Bacillaceae bacterium]
MEWKLKTFEELTNVELYRILQERVNVFVVEQECPYPEVDGHDFVSRHLFLQDGDKVAAYLRILPKGTTYPEASIGRVIVSKDYRKRGLGLELMSRALEFIRENTEDRTVKIQAQEYLRRFYGSFGFQAVSDVYLEDGIPHIDMVLVMDK